MTTVLISRLKDYCRTRGYYIQDELNPFDRKRNGILNPIGFRRFFSQIEFPITEQQFKDLCELYAVPNGIDVIKFYNDVENADSTSSMQKTDKMSVIPELRKLKNILAGRRTNLRELLKAADPNFTGYVTKEAVFAQLGFGHDIKKIVNAYEFQNKVCYMQIQKDLESFDSTFKAEKPDLTEIATNILKVRFDIAYAMSQFDRTRSGRITVHQFNSLIHEYCNDAPRIAEFYTDCDGFINTRDFLRDLYEQTQKIEKMQVEQTIQRKYNDRSDPQEVLKYIKKQLALRHVNPRSYFAGREDRQYIEMPLFVHIVSEFKISINQKDIISLAESFNTPKGIDLQRFLSSFDAAPREAPIARVSDLRNYLHQTHQRVAPLAMKSDRQREGYLDGSTLRAILTRLQFYFTPQDIPAYIHAFPAKHDRNYLDWHDFVAAVDPPEETRPPPNYYEPAETIRPRTARIHADFNENLIPVLQKINTAARRLCISMEEEFVHNDPLKTGQVSVKVFNEIMGFAELSMEELNAIIRNYPNVNYVDLCEHLKSPQTQPMMASSAKIQTDPTRQIQEMLSKLKSNLIYNAIAITDIITNNMSCERAVNLLSKYTQDAKQIIEAFRDPRRPEVVDLFELQRALDSTNAAKMKLLKCSMTTLNTELCAMRQKAQARRCKLEKMFAGCPASISPEEFCKRLSVLFISFNPRELEIFKAKYELDGGIDWASVCRDAENSHAH